MTIAFGNVAVGGLPAGLLPQWLRSTDSKGWALTGRFPCPGRSAALAFVCRRTFAPRRTLQGRAAFGSRKRPPLPYPGLTARVFRPLL